MKFGRVHDIEAVDFTLPPVARATTDFLSALPAYNSDPAVYIGCSVWTDPSFLGRIYPPKLSEKARLAYYCQQFNAVELNATFYGIPDVNRVLQWKKSASTDFRFCPKMPQHLSHRKTPNTSEMLRFFDTVSHFGNHLGTTFIQLPPYIGPKYMDRIQKLLTLLPAGYPLALEIRHEDWFSQTAAQESLWQQLQEQRIAAVITDAAGRRDALHQRITAPRIFIRFVGNNLHPTDYQRIDAWVPQLLEWGQQGVQEIYFFLHQPVKGACGDLAAYMIRQLNSYLQQPLRAPKLHSREGYVAT